MPVPYGAGLRATPSFTSVPRSSRLARFLAATALEKHPVAQRGPTRTLNEGSRSVSALRTESGIRRGTLRQQCSWGDDRSAF